MKVAMRRRGRHLLCRRAVVSVAFLVWFNADPDTNITAILSSLPLSYLYAISSGLAAFSVGALVALVAGSLAHLRMPNLPRVIFAALGWVVLGFLLLAPVIATLANNSAAIVFALVVYAAIKVPVVFAAFGLSWAWALPRGATPSNSTAGSATVL